MASTSDKLHLKVADGLKMMELTVAADSDFNDVKKLIWKQTGYPVDSQVLLFRGKPQDSGNSLYGVGVRDGAKLLLSFTEDKKKELAEEADHKRKVEVASAKATEQLLVMGVDCDEMSLAMDNIDKEIAADGSSAEHKKQLTMINEMLERHLLTIDGLDRELTEEATALRKSTVKRINAMCDRSETLKSKVFIIYSGY